VNTSIDYPGAINYKKMVDVMISRNLIQAKQIATSIIKEKRSNSRTSRAIAKAQASDES
jgi:hypothetical protein